MFSRPQLFDPGLFLLGRNAFWVIHVGVVVVGYVVVVVIGFLIALIMVFVTRLLKQTLGEYNQKSEMFMTANRSIRTGLTASAVVSGWLWSTAMLGSALVGYNFGVAGPFWFAAG